MADNINISPDMISNLVKMLKNSNNDNDSTFQNNSSNRKDTINTNNTNDFDDSNNTNNIDFETIMRIKSIMEKLNNSNNQDSTLLYSLKPYLRKSRQKKLDQYINILKISQVSKLFNQKGDGN